MTRKSGSDAVDVPPAGLGQAATICSAVLYTLAGADVDAVNRRRDDWRASPAATWGYQAHVGNRVQIGDQFPAIVVRTFGDQPNSPVNLHVLLDGADTLWVTSRVQGGGTGQWLWPPRA